MNSSSTVDRNCSNSSNRNRLSGLSVFLSLLYDVCLVLIVAVGTALIWINFKNTNDGRIVVVGGLPSLNDGVGNGRGGFSLFHKSGLVGD